jgi:hypothetical protein
MADSVQELMEAMVPELQDLVDHKILSQVSYPPRIPLPRL